MDKRNLLVKEVLELSKRETDIILNVYDSPGVTIKKIATELKLSGDRVRFILNDLEKVGLVSREKIVGNGDINTGYVYQWYTLSQEKLYYTLKDAIETRCSMYNLILEKEFKKNENIK